MKTTRYEAGGLRCIEVVAETPEPMGGRPLVVGLHGLGDRGDSYVDLAALLPPDYRYIFPTAAQPVRYGGAIAGYAWFDFAHRDFATFAEARPALDRLFGTLTAKYSTPPARTVLFGFSQGAMVTLDYGLRRGAGERFAGLGAMSGFLPEAVATYAATLGVPAPDSNAIGGILTDAARANQPILITHGRRDGIVPILAAQETRATLEKYGLHPQYHEFDAAHEITPAMLGVLRTFLAGVLA